MERPADPVTAAPSAIDRHPTGLVAALASLPSLLVAALRLFVRHSTRTFALAVPIFPVAMSRTLTTMRWLPFLVWSSAV